MEGSIANTVLLALAGLAIIRAGISGTDAYGAFVSGAEQGVKAAVRLVPCMTAMMLMVGMMESSGMIGYLIGFITPAMKWLNLPKEAAAILMLRPLTGSGSIAALEQIYASCGPDSRAARAASVLMGSSETIFYTMTVYLGVTGAKKLKYVLPVSMISYMAGIVVCGLTV